MRFMYKLTFLFMGKPKRVNYMQQAFMFHDNRTAAIRAIVWDYLMLDLLD